MHEAPVPSVNQRPNSQELTATGACSDNPPRSEAREGSAVPHKPLSRPDSSSQESAPQESNRSSPPSPGFPNPSLLRPPAPASPGPRGGPTLRPRLFQDRAMMERGDLVRTGALVEAEPVRPPEIKRGKPPGPSRARNLQVRAPPRHQNPAPARAQAPPRHGPAPKPGPAPCARRCQALAPAPRAEVLAAPAPSHP